MTPPPRASPAPTPVSLPQPPLSRSLAPPHLTSALQEEEREEEEEEEEDTGRSGRRGDLGVLDADGRAEGVRHVVRLGGGAVVALLVVEEGEEDGVDGGREGVHEGGAHEPRHDQDDK